MLPVLRNDLGTYERWALSYLHDSHDFRIGNIVDPETPAGRARQVVEETLGYEFGPIVHVSLAHQDHTMVNVLVARPGQHTTVVCDAVIFPKDWRIAVETFVGDCVVVTFIGTDHVGYAHVGRPELFAGLIPAFRRLWPDNPATTQVVMGPGICGDYYELPNVSTIVGTKLERFVTTTTWETQGYDVSRAIRWQLGQLEFGSREIPILQSPMCPFHGLTKGWWLGGSDQYYRVKKMDPTRAFSPRDCALLYPA